MFPENFPGGVVFFSRIFCMIPGFDLPEFLLTVGYIGLFIVIFAETGLFLGFFLPGDSLLFVAGLLASNGLLSLPALLGIVFTAAIIGNTVGYFFGKRVGPALFTRDESILFKRSYVEKAEEFFNCYGAKTILLARFMPIVRTFAPILAGVGKMDFREFFFFNVIGAFLWSFGLILGGYFLGRIVPDVDRYILPIVLLIVVASILPGALKLLKESKKKTESKK